MSLQVLDETYFAQYQADSVSDQALAAYDQIADVLKAQFRPRNACDVGSGGGALIRGLQKRNVDAVGIEGSIHAVRLMPGSIVHHDLRQPYKAESISFGGYDLVTSFDVGEHIEAEYHGVFCDSIKGMMGNRGYLVFGAAGQGQDGLGHVACFHPCHWIDLFEKRGFRLMAGRSESVRAEIEARDGTNFLWWCAKNLLVFLYEGRP
jgi:cyclopropane fatty-acyl-phospholipid synthase-like methyltransferase